jgi:hypothetical protein
MMGLNVTVCALSWETRFDKKSREMERVRECGGE